MSLSLSVGLEIVCGSLSSFLEILGGAHHGFCTFTSDFLGLFLDSFDSTYNLICKLMGFLDGVLLNLIDKSFDLCDLLVSARNLMCGLLENFNLFLGFVDNLVDFTFDLLGLVLSVLLEILDALLELGLDLLCQSVTLGLENFDEAGGLTSELFADFVGLLGYDLEGVFSLILQVVHPVPIPAPLLKLFDGKHVFFGKISHGVEGW